MRFKLLASVVAITGILGGVAAQVAAESPREEAMKKMGKSIKVIKGVIDAGGPAADIVSPAQKIAEIAAKIPEVFPKDSDTEDDEARAEIWTKWDVFTAHAKDLETAATMLASAANGGDMATVGAQFEKVGGACGACHKEFREKK